MCVLNGCHGFSLLNTKKSAISQLCKIYSVRRGKAMTFWIELLLEMKVGYIISLLKRSVAPVNGGMLALHH